MEEWQNERKKEWKNEKMAEWQNGRVAEWQNGSIAESGTEEEADAPGDADGGKTAHDENRQKCGRHSDPPALLQRFFGN